MKNLMALCLALTAFSTAAHADQQQIEVPGSAMTFCGTITPCETVRESVCMSAKRDARNAAPGCFGFSGSCECAVEDAGRPTQNMTCEITMTATCNVAGTTPSPSPQPAPQPAPAPGCTASLGSWARVRPLSTSNPAYNTWTRFEGGKFIFHVGDFNYTVSPGDILPQSTNVTCYDSDCRLQLIMKDQSVVRTMPGHETVRMNNAMLMFDSRAAAEAAQVQITNLISSCSSLSLNDIFNHSPNSSPAALAIEIDSSALKSSNGGFEFPSQTGEKRAQGGTQVRVD